MAPACDPHTRKESFLQDNQLFSELELTAESKPIGKLQDFDLLDNEIWLLQCPKGMDVSSLESQKLKIPGRTNVNDSEAVSMEFNYGKEQQAFAYCNRKGRFSVSLLPVSGTIVLRNRLKAAETVTAERAEECCPPAKRVPLPANIRVRHPLLGAQYKDKLDLDKSIVKRLQAADEISIKILKESLNRKNQTMQGLANDKKASNDDDDAVEFVSEDKLKKKKKKNKRKHSESNAETNECLESSNSKKKKSKKSDETVSKDLEWLQNI